MLMNKIKTKKTIGYIKYYKNRILMCLSGVLLGLFSTQTILYFIIDKLIYNEPIYLFICIIMTLLSILGIIYGYQQNLRKTKTEISHFYDNN